MVNFIKKYGIDDHLMRKGVSDKEHYIMSLKGKIAFVLQTIPNDREFVEYKKLFDLNRL